MNVRRCVLQRKNVLASLVAGALVVVAFQTAALAGDGFGDVPSSNVHHNSVAAVRDAGVTHGCRSAAYCPGDAVRRDQMASFMDRLGALSGQEPVVNAATARQAEDSKRLGGVGASDIFARLTALEGATGGDGATDPDLVERVETLEAELAAAFGRIGTLEGDLADSNDRIGTLEGDLADSNDRIGTLEGQLADAGSRIADLEDAVNQLLDEHNLNLLSASK